MPLINYAARELNCKIAYVGAGFCGKTTNLHYLHAQVAADNKGKLISLATETDRVLFFDFLPLDAGTVRGFKTRFHLYTVPGQVFYGASCKPILKGVDGIVFVADSRAERMEANLEALDNLGQNLQSQGFDLAALPYVLQLNKRDAPNALPAAEMTARLIRQTPPEPVFEAVASQGRGVVETFREAARLVVAQISKSG